MTSDSKITFRAPEPSDLDMLFRWENDADAWRQGRTRAPWSRHALWQYIENYDADILAAGQSRFILMVDELPVGCIDLYDIDTINRRAGVGIYIAAEHRCKGLATASLAMMAYYCRIQLGLHQLWAIISADNTDSRSAFRKVGFKECGRLRSWIRVGESYTDALQTQLLLIPPR
ncbi:MAG: GNAT family N-acetyltransferase [Bacteroides sp.]|nr:GNAT family N-acetyltransferase [Bacteroides sp.]MCM1414182.1 GNAT family N-acetyltransferase [Bacteroides sp.]MCM1471268.1 GNAT family N-acetyltransferase [Bacteroides sp.]